MGEFRIVGGDIALDLVNTVEPRIAGRAPERDHLGTPRALLRWAECAHLIDAPTREQVAAAWATEPGTALAALEEVLQLRAAVGAAIDATRERVEDATGAEALHTVLQRAAAALTHATLVPDPDRRRPVRRLVGTRPASLVQDRLAVAALDLLQTADLNRVKTCPPEHGGCGWIFIDSSKNGSRRWCSMEDCGTRVKSRRLTERRRTNRTRTEQSQD